MEEFGLLQRFGHANRRFKFQKCCQLFIRLDNETLSVAAMRISNPNCSPA
jgi:hypothetical protein